MKEKRKSTWQDSYFFDKSFVDRERSCVHVPVNMPKIKGVVDGDIEDSYVLEEVKKKYPEFIFMGGQDLISDESGVKEYLFFYRIRPNVE